jgi:hypothetical protein
MYSGRATAIGRSEMAKATSIQPNACRWADDLVDRLEPLRHEHRETSPRRWSSRNPASHPTESHHTAQYAQSSSARCHVPRREPRGSEYSGAPRDTVALRTARRRPSIGLLQRRVAIRGNVRRAIAVAAPCRLSALAPQRFYRGVARGYPSRVYRYAKWSALLCVQHCGLDGEMCGRDHPSVRDRSECVPPGMKRLRVPPTVSPRERSPRGALRLGEAAPPTRTRSQQTRATIRLSLRGRWRADLPQFLWIRVPHPPALSITRNDRNLVLPGPSVW